MPTRPDKYPSAPTEQPPNLWGTAAGAGHRDPYGNHSDGASRPFQIASAQENQDVVRNSDGSTSWAPSPDNWPEDC